MVTIQQMVDREVLCCMSSIVSTLAQACGGFDSVSGGSERGVAPLRDLAEQAAELASPVPDYEEAARQEGWKTADLTPHALVNDSVVDESGQGQFFTCPLEADIWNSVCISFNIEPINSEVYEHWAVTGWLADKLIKHGEKVDKDFGDLCVWARTTTGQRIASDRVIGDIHIELLKA